MTLSEVSRREINGQTMYRAQDVARVYKCLNTRCVTKHIPPTEKVRITTNPTNWRCKQHEVYITREGMRKTAMRFSPEPLHKVMAAL